ncbi:hypothetical protein [Streptomyces sp. IBSBF 2806]|uniref:hypothetical protein n=1 Tax=Streptomyces sp. IBSBF 2806 TaxID=2903529 RepID=UPI002FDBF6A1
MPGARPKYSSAASPRSASWRRAWPCSAPRAPPWSFWPPAPTGGLSWIATALFLTACPVGLILPTTTALSLQRAPHAAGSASALLGTTQFLMGAVAPALTGLGAQGTALPTALPVLDLALAAVVCFAVLCRPWRPAPDPLAR